jgi:hypothetical protein
MRCPHCEYRVHVDWKYDGIVYEDLGESGMSAYRDPEGKFEHIGREVVQGKCPECDGLIVGLRVGECYLNEVGELKLREISPEPGFLLLYPKTAARSKPPEVPPEIWTEYAESRAVLEASPKASAALSRRIVQTILRNCHDIKRRNLADEIQVFIDMPSVPGPLASAVDAIRAVGNFAAHPTKSLRTGEIAEVEPEEAEWLLEVLESLFDFTFIQPERQKRMTERLNEKLENLGKPRMKSRTEAEPDPN